MKNQTERKSFILHKDSLSVLKKLSKEQAGELFLAISDYQTTGQLPESNFISIIFEPFLNQFQRDEKKHHESIIQGKLGNLKKYHNEIYLKVIEGQLSLEEGEIAAYPEKLIKSSVGRPPITPDQVGSLSVSVSVSKSVSVNNSILEDSKGDFLQNQNHLLGEQENKNSESGEEERKKKSSAKRTKKEFITPTLEEVKAYCLERNNRINPESWMDHYTSNGWKVGKNPMKDWKAAVRQWERNSFEGKTNNNNFDLDKWKQF